jgi:hypothetical protein
MKMIKILIGYDDEHHKRLFNCIFTFFYLFFLFNCSSTPTKIAEDKFTPIVLYFDSCNCDISKYKNIVEKEIVSEGIHNYCNKKSIKIEPEIEDEFLTKPEVFLQNFYMKEDSNNQNQKNLKATANFNETLFEKSLLEKPFINQNGTKVYSRKPSYGLKGLELIKNFPLEKKKNSENIDKDRHYRDRIDNLAKYKYNNQR